MYNKEQKLRYFDDRKTKIQIETQQVVVPYFEAIAPYEEKYGKDCSNFTVTEIAEFYSMLMTHSLSRLITMNSQFSVYTSWCMLQNTVVDNQNHFAEMSPETLMKYVNTGFRDSLFITREQLLKTFNEIPNVSDCFLSLAIFEGLGGQKYSDFYNLKLENFDGNIVSVNKRKLEVSDKLVELAEESSETYVKYSSEGVLKKGYKATDDGVIKRGVNAGLPSISANQRTIFMRLYNLEEEFGKAFGYNALRNSGRISLLNKLIKEDGSKNARETYEKHRKEIEYRYGKLGTRVVYWLQENAQYILSA